MIVVDCDWSAAPVWWAAYDCCATKATFRSNKRTSGTFWGWMPSWLYLIHYFTSVSKMSPIILHKDYLKLKIWCHRVCFFVFPRWWLIQHDRASMSRSVIVCLRQISLNRAQRKGNHGVPVILIQSFHRWSWWKLWKKRKVQLWTFSHIPWPHSCPSSEKPDSRSDVQNQRNLLLVILRDIDG